MKKVPRLKTNCKFCKQEFEYIRCRKTAIFCSKNCYSRGKNKLGLDRPRICQFCRKTFTSKSHSLTTFCSEKCSRTHEGLKRQNSTVDNFFIGKPTALPTVKRILIETYGCCERCNYLEVNILELHHKDRNPKNNTPTNVELLCPNCHRLDHYKAKDGPFKTNLGKAHNKKLIEEKLLNDCK